MLPVLPAVLIGAAIGSGTSAGVAALEGDKKNIWKKAALGAGTGALTAGTGAAMGVPTPMVLAAPAGAGLATSRNPAIAQTGTALLTLAALGNAANAAAAAPAAGAAAPVAAQVPPRLPLVPTDTAQIAKSAPGGNLLSMIPAR